VYDQAVFIRTLSEFTRHLLTPHDSEQALSYLARDVTEILGLGGSGVSLGRGNGLIVVTPVPEHLAALERAQQDYQSGPCVAAYREERIVAVENLGDQTKRWPQYCRVAESIGVTSVAAVPMHVHGVRVGALSLYGDRHRAWPEDDLAVAVVMADMATGYLINASVLHHQEELNAQLQKALTSRIVIEQAKGALANRHRISVDHAFDRMRRYARGHNETLHKVAEQVVTGDLTL